MSAPTPMDMSSYAHELREAGHFEAALALARRAVALEPKDARLWSNAAMLHLAARNLDEARNCICEAFALDPDLKGLYHNLGLIELYSGKLDKALSCFEIDLDGVGPEAGWDRALVLLAMGNWAEGWAAAECRLSRSTEKPKIPQWGGEPGARLWVTAEQGIGDTIQFARYLTWARERVEHLTFDCWPELIPLMRGYPGIDVLRHHPAPVPREDATHWISLMSLPMLHGTRPDLVVPDPGHFAQLEKQASPLDAVLAKGLLVGICWAGRPQHRMDRFRTVDLRHFLRLVSIPEVNLISLQVGDRQADIKACGAERLLTDFGVHLRRGGWRATADVLRRLNLLITVDTGIAHLAGALGVPTWLVLHKDPDWRWLLRGRNSVWYPSVSLYRMGPWATDWNGVFHSIEEDLRVRVRAKSLDSGSGRW